MSFKVDLLLRKATTFERLSLYGDRKVFLQALAQNAPVPGPSPWDMYDEAGDPRGNHKNWIPQVENGQYVYVGPNHYMESTHSLPSGELPRLVEPAPGGGGQWVDPHADRPSAVDRDEFIPLQKQLNAPAVPEKGSASKPSAPYTTQLVNTLNAFSGRAADMNDTQKATTVKQLNSTTLAELARILQRLGGYDNPYSTPQEQALTQQIRAAVDNFRQAFAAQITEAPSASRLAQ